MRAIPPVAYLQLVSPREIFFRPSQLVQQLSHVRLRGLGEEEVQQDFEPDGDGAGAEQDQRGQVRDGTDTRLVRQAVI